MSEEEQGVFHHHSAAAEYDEPVEGEENPFYQQRHRQQQQQPRRKQHQRATPAAAALERDHLIPFQQPTQDPNTMSVNYQVTDAVAYYGNVALWALFYGRGTRGIVAPVLYDTERGTL